MKHSKKISNNYVFTYTLILPPKNNKEVSTLCLKGVLSCSYHGCDLCVGVKLRGLTRKGSSIPLKPIAEGFIECRVLLKGITCSIFIFIFILNFPMIPNECSPSIIGKNGTFFFFLRCFKNQMPAIAKIFLFSKCPWNSSRKKYVG